MTSTAPSFRVFSVMVLLALGLGRVGAQTAPVAAAAVRSVEELRAQLEAHVTQPRFKAALWGVKIVSLDTGRTLFEHHGDRLLSPASNSKLYAGALVLDQLGGDYRIVTPIFAAGKPDRAGTVAGDVVVSGRGDPSWKARGASKESGKDFWSTFAPLVAVLEQAAGLALDVLTDGKLAGRCHRRYPLWWW